MKSSKEIHKISDQFCNEVYYRTESAMNAIDILIYFRQTKKETAIKGLTLITHDLWRADEMRKSILYISPRHALLEMATLIDGNGELSLHLSKQKKNGTHYKIQKDKLRKLFSSLDDHLFNILYTELSNLIKRNSHLIDRILKTRHERVAHAGKSSYELDKVMLSSVRFPKKKFYKFAMEFQGVIMRVCLAVLAPLEKIDSDK